MKYDKNIETSNTHISKLCLKKFSNPEVHTKGTKFLFYDNLLFFENKLSDLFMMHKIVFQVFLESQETSWKYFRHVRTEIETNFLDTHQAQFFGSKIPLIA